MGKEISINEVIIAEPDIRPKVTESGMRGPSGDAWHFGAGY